MLNSLQDLYHLIPLLIVSGGILISIVVEMYSKDSEKILFALSILVFGAAGLFSLYSVNNVSILFNGMLATGGNVNVFSFIFNIGAFIVTLLSADYIRKYGTYYGEYYIILQSSVLGMMLMAGAKDLFIIFIGLELMSISFYVLAGLNRKRLNANEASLKYFLLGAFATGFIVYGIGLIYGTAQTTSIDILTVRFPQLTGNLLFLAGVLLFLVGFTFKIAAFPFHMWVPDVYQGSPTVVAGLFSTGGKAAAFSAILVTLAALFNGNVGSLFTPYLIFISALSMIYGSIVAISQDDIKRMLAYSSISHAGYLAIGLAAGNSEGTAGIIFYLAAYSFMNLGAFGIVALIEGENETNLLISSYAGLAKRNPALAALLSIFMFSLSGIPPFAGFFGKYYVFFAAIKSGLTWLALIGILSSVISVYFYLRIVVLMYFKDQGEEVIPSKSAMGMVGVVLSAILVVLLGVFPGSIINLISSFL
jgi:NADH-quinone oxidoreductase subunit N